MSVPVLFVESVGGERLADWIQRREPWPQEWIDIGLSDYFADIRDLSACAVNEMASGPRNVAGCTVAVWPENAEPPELGFYPQRQEWIETDVPVCVRCDGNPRPEDLERHVTPAKSTESVVFANRSVWDVPVLREPAPGYDGLRTMDHVANLPQSVSRNLATGDWEIEVLPQYAELFEQSRRWFEFFMDVDTAQLNWSELFGYVQQVMSLRYRYTEFIHRVFGSQWITTDNVFDVMRVSCGFSLVQRSLAEKKKMATVH